MRGDHLCSPVIEKAPIKAIAVVGLISDQSSWDLV
jgi:hypothetical protein